jgi:PIN domain nuclease of toxin-antitoxin system
VNLLLDTHVLLWALLGGEELSAAQREHLERAEKAGEVLALAAITLWEIAMLAARGRLTMRGSVDVLLSEIENHPRFEVLPITARIALESTRLGPSFHRDPADQLIAATCRVHGLTLLTADERIRASAVVAVL